MRTIAGWLVGGVLAATVGLTVGGTAWAANNSPSDPSQYSRASIYFGKQWTPARLSLLRAEIVDLRYNR
jgi:hypothetical protein